MILVAVIRGQPVSKPSSETGETNPTHGPYGGPEHSDSWAMRFAAQAVDPHHRLADWIPSWEAPAIVARGRRRTDA
jgi:hypothetical protein